MNWNHKSSMIRLLLKCNSISGVRASFDGPSCQYGNELVIVSCTQYHPYCEGISGYNLWHSGKTLDLA